jgi:phosphatidate phosphatase PAH1
MRGVPLLAAASLYGCAVEHEPPTTDPVLPPGVVVGTSAVPDVRCAELPDAGPAGAWRHTASDLIAHYGAPHHRGIDLIAADDDATQLLTGKLAYGPTDTDLEDEDVELFACIDARWQPVGTARTDDEGRFSLALTGDERLPAGMRDLYVSVVGDRTGARFVGFVAPRGTKLVVSDVDGTLTGSENAYPLALVSGGDVPAQPDAAAALMSLAVRGYAIVYVTARGDRFTQDTRDWFAAKGFPRGPMRLPPAIVTAPGADTVEFKTAALAALAAFEVAAGIGNRASDVAAYTAAGLAPERIFIKLPEFSEELAPALTAGDATGFALYEELRTQYLAAM